MVNHFVLFLIKFLLHEIQIWGKVCERKRKLEIFEEQDNFTLKQKDTTTSARLWPTLMDKFR